MNGSFGISAYCNDGPITPEIASQGIELLKYAYYQRYKEEACFAGFCSLLVSMAMEEGITASRFIEAIKNHIKNEKTFGQPFISDILKFNRLSVRFVEFSVISSSKHTEIACPSRYRSPNSGNSYWVYMSELDDVGGDLYKRVLNDNGIIMYEEYLKKKRYEARRK